MTKILIIEDEIPARKKLLRFIETLDASVEIIGEIDTVFGAIEFLKNYTPDLIFSDIELLDGNVFEIYEQVSVTCPIIFTTAYDRFWMEAFESNGIAYLLKPFSKEHFQKAWDKFLWLQNSVTTEQNTLTNLARLIKENFSKKTYKKRFSINTPKGTYFLETASIVFFEAVEGVVFAHDSSRKKHLLIAPTLKQIEDELNPSEFFRINRSELVNKAYIEKIERYNKNTLAVTLKGCDTLLKTSQSQTAVFRQWLEQ